MTIFLIFSHASHFEILATSITINCKYLWVDGIAFVAQHEIQHSFRRTAHQRPDFPHWNTIALSTRRYGGAVAGGAACNGGRLAIWAARGAVDERPDCAYQCCAADATGNNGGGQA